MCVEDKLGIRKKASSLSTGGPGERSENASASSKGISLWQECLVDGSCCCKQNLSGGSREHQTEM